MNLANISFIEQLGEVGLEPGEAIICCSGVMALHGIRDNKDLDLVVPLCTWNQLMKDLPVSFTKFDRPYLKYEALEIFNQSGPTGQEFNEITTQFFDDHLFQSFQSLLKWKSEMGREKDIVDVKLIADQIKKYAEEVICDNHSHLEWL